MALHVVKAKFVTGGYPEDIYQDKMEFLLPATDDVTDQQLYQRATGYAKALVAAQMGCEDSQVYITSLWVELFREQ